MCIRDRCKTDNEDCECRLAHDGMSEYLLRGENSMFCSAHHPVPQSEQGGQRGRDRPQEDSTQADHLPEAWFGDGYLDACLAARCGGDIDGPCCSPCGCLLYTSP